MNARDSTEKSTLKALQRIFADPVATAKRYRRYALLCIVGATAASFASGMVGDIATSENAQKIFRLLVGAAGALLGVGIYFLNCAWRAPHIAKYCTLDAAAVQRRLSEIAK